MPIRIVTSITALCFLFHASPLLSGNCESLVQAAYEGEIKKVERIARPGAQVNCRSRNTGDTPLTAAARRGNLEIAKILVTRGASVNMPNVDGAIPLYEASQSCGCNCIPCDGCDCARAVPLVSLLVEKGASVHAKNSDGRTPLFAAANRSAVEVVKFLLSKGARADVADREGITPLHLAAGWGNCAIARLLLEKGASVEGRTAKMTTPLQWAANEGRYEMMRLLLGHGANPRVEEEIVYDDDEMQVTKKVTPIANYALKHDRRKALALAKEFNIAVNNDENMRMVSEERSSNNLRHGIALILNIAYLCLAVLLRERVFRDKPEYNILGFLHALACAIPLCVIPFSALGVLVFGNMLHHGGNPFAAMGITGFGIIAGAVPGLILSLILAYKYRTSFATERFQYYAAPVITLFIIAAFPELIL